MVACYEGDFSQARRLVEESLRFWQQRGHPRWIAGMLNRRSVIATYEGHLTAARADAEESLRLYQQVGDAYSAANAQRQLARCLIRQGEIDRADALLRSALAAQTRSNAKRTLLATLEAIALLDATRHESERSVRLLGACAALRQTFAAPLPPVESQAQASVLADLDKALGPQTFQRAQEEGRRLTLQQAISEALP
jgi:tetratricopeptide (TPR) repeat protein